MTHLTEADRAEARTGGERGIHFVHPPGASGFQPFLSGRHVIGRNPSCAIRLEGRAVSWEHAELKYDGRTAVLRDLKSTNGVLVDGRPITETQLRDGQVVRLGDFLAVVGTAPPVVAGGSPFTEAAALGMFIGPQLYEALGPLRLRPGQIRPLLVEGETGVGKAMVARLSHELNARPGNFLTLDCGQLDPGTAARRLFGQDGVGALDHALEGTSYLANVTALHPANQQALAQTLRARWGQPLHLVLGSQEPLLAAVAAGRLQQPLCQLLLEAAGQPVSLPPLRRRVTEIPGLCRRLFEQRGHGRVPLFSADLVERLCLYDWPCNVRELVLLVERLARMHGDELRLRSAHLPARMLPPNEEKTTSPVTPVNGVDSTSLLDALRKAGGSIEQAAALLGITRERAYRLIERLGPAAGRAGA